MANYMILLREDEPEQQRMALTEVKALLSRRAAFVEALRKEGKYRDGERLRPTAEASRVRADSVEPGPFADAAALGGYFVVETETLEAAVEVASGLPLGPGDSLDVRPVMGGIIRADKAEARGKVFAFAVLGNARNEPEWVSLMDRIDHDTRANAADPRFAGGVRLEAPGRGRQVELRGEKRSVLDGPFLESKEVIGGIFFMRLPDMDEAIRWAQSSKFMRHGALEVRELWRS